MKVTLLQIAQWQLVQMIAATMDSATMGNAFVTMAITLGIAPSCCVQMIVRAMAYAMPRMGNANVFKDTLERTVPWVVVLAIAPTMAFATVVNVLVMMVGWARFVIFNYVQMIATSRAYVTTVFASATQAGPPMIVASRRVTNAFTESATEPHVFAMKVGLDGLVI